MLSHGYIYILQLCLLRESSGLESERFAKNVEEFEDDLEFECDLEPENDLALEDDLLDGSDFDSEGDRDKPCGG